MLYDTPLPREYSQDLSTQMRGVLCLNRFNGQNRNTKTFYLPYCHSRFMTYHHEFVTLRTPRLRLPSPPSTTTHSISPVPFPPSIYTSSSLHNLIISNPSSMTSSIPSHSSSSEALHRLLLTSLAWAEDSRSGNMTCSNNWVICWPVCTALCFE